jgi:peptide-methionine (S)-S-oxide reductase
MCVFASQDPTTPNQQGPDRGSSYRSIVLEMQQRKNIEEIKELPPIKFANPIVTEVKPVSDFMKRKSPRLCKNNPNQPYVKGFLPRYNKFKKHIKEN